MSSMWSSGIGKFPKKDPDHGNWWIKVRHWLCNWGLCNLDKCSCDCHPRGRSKAYFPTLPKKAEDVLETKKKVVLVKKWEGSRMVTKEVEVDE